MSDALDLVTLAEAKAFLNMDTDDTSEDTELANFITGMTPVVEAEVGPVVLRSQTAVIYGMDANAVPAPTWPVASVTSGTYLSNSTSVDVSKMIADQGLILTSDGSTLPLLPWTMTYQAGRVANTAAVPLNIKSGALEILKLAWESQRGGTPPAFLISYRAAAWFKPSAFAVGFA